MRGAYCCIVRKHNFHNPMNALHRMSTNSEKHPLSGTFLKRATAEWLERLH